MPNEDDCTCPCILCTVTDPPHCKKGAPCYSSEHVRDAQKERALERIIVAQTAAGDEMAHIIDREKRGVCSGLDECECQRCRDVAK